MAITPSLARTLSATLQDAATTGNGTATLAKVTSEGSIREHTIYIVGSAGVGAGAIQLETAHTTSYAGTWAPLGSPVTVTASTTTVVQVTGALRAVRARISTTVTGGTVSVYYEGN